MISWSLPRLVGQVLLNNLTIVTRRQFSDSIGLVRSFLLIPTLCILYPFAFTVMSRHCRSKNFIDPKGSHS